MLITQDSTSGIYMVRSYSNDSLTINDSAVNASVCISAQSLVLLPELSAASGLTDAHAATIMATDPEVVLLGTGTHQVFPATQWTKRFLTRAVGVEVMTTAAACRTYNVLASERRRVTAILIL